MNEEFDSLLESVGIGVAREEDPPASNHNRPQEHVTFHLPDGDLEVPIIREEEEDSVEVHDVSLEEAPQSDAINTAVSSLSEDDLADILTDNGYDPFEESNEEEDEEEEEHNEVPLPDAQYVGFHTVSEPIGTVDHTQEVAARIQLVEEELSRAVDALVAERFIAAATAAQQPTDTTYAESEEGNIERPRIAPNSPTLTIDDTTARFSGAEWYSEIQKAKIIVGGCGGISSNVCFQLARMAPAALYIYDDDTVETVNMAGQLFNVDDVGRYKVDAITTMIRKYTNMGTVYAVREKFYRDTEAGDIMVCGFDNMTARRDFFNAWQAHVWNKPVEERSKCLFLDGRLSLAEFQVLCIQGDDNYNMSRYRDEFLFTEEEAEHTVCSMKQTTYLACMIASFMVNLFTNFIANTISPIIPYDLPFFTEYDAPNMLFRTEN